MPKELFKEKVEKIVKENLRNGETLQGFFMAQYRPSFKWYFIVGPLSSFGIRQYYIAATNHGMHFHKMTFWGKPDKLDIFNYNEIKNLNVGRGIVTRKLKFTFNNGRKLKLRAFVKAHSNMPKLEADLLSYIQQNIGK